jgi:hypothetical protein
VSGGDCLGASAVRTAIASRADRERDPKGLSQHRSPRPSPFVVEHPRQQLGLDPQRREAKL